MELALNIGLRFGLIVWGFYLVGIESWFLASIPATLLYLGVEHGDRS
jgi:hypothetical protein